MNIMGGIEEKISLLEKTYDSIRVVDPLKKCTLLFKEGNIVLSEGSCFDLWNKNEFCENCIAMRAYLENDTFVKLEYQDKLLLLITATPIVIEDKVFVVELLKDITKTGSFYNLKTDSEISFDDIIDGINDKFVRDELTGAYNRRYIDERLLVDIHSTEMRGIPISLILMDINNMDELNREFSYKIGDVILKELSALLNETTRKNSDWVGRFEGDCFMIVLSDADYDNAIIVGNKIKKIIENKRFKYNEEQINIKVSFSAFSTSTSIRDLNSIYNELKEKLKEAKKNETDEISIGILKDKNAIHLNKLNRSIEELRDTLNEICATTDNEVDYRYRLKISEYLDALIVEYMQKIEVHD